MDTSSVDIHEGMDVVDRDDQKLGSVAGVHSEPPGGAPLVGELDVTESGCRVHHGSPVSQESAVPTAMDAEKNNSVPGGSCNSDVPRGSGYLEVTEGGIAGVGALHLYVPYAAVLSVVPGQSVLVDCHKDECLERFGEKPGWLPD